jgi:hypothetical protein
VNTAVNDSIATWYQRTSNFVVRSSCPFPVPRSPLPVPGSPGSPFPRNLLPSSLTKSQRPQVPNANPSSEGEG